MSFEDFEYAYFSKENNLSDDNQFEGSDRSATPLDEFIPETPTTSLEDDESNNSCPGSPDNESNNSRPESPDNESNNSCSESPDNESNNSYPATPTTSFNNDGSNNIHLTCTTRVEIDAEHKENTHFKWLKTSHPLWSYFKWSSDKKNAYCNLCRACYSNKTGISTIKRHFEHHHRTEYDQYQQSTLVLRSVEYYGNCDEKNSSDSLDFYFVGLFVTNKLLILLMMTIFVL